MKDTNSNEKKESRQPDNENLEKLGNKLPEQVFKNDNYDSNFSTNDNYNSINNSEIISELKSPDKIIIIHEKKIPLQKIKNLFLKIMERKDIKLICFMKWKETIKPSRKRIYSIKRQKIVFIKKDQPYDKDKNEDIQNINLREKKEINKNKEMILKKLIYKRDYKQIYFTKWKNLISIKINEKNRVFGSIIIKLKEKKKFIELIKKLIEKTNERELYYFEKWKQLFIRKKTSTFFKSNQIQKQKDDNQKLKEFKDNIENFSTPEEDKEKNKVEIRPNQKEFNEIYNNIANILKKGDKTQRKESKKILISILENIDDKNDESVKIKIIDFKKSFPNSEKIYIKNIKERAYKLIKNAFEKSDLKRKYFLIWKKTSIVSKDEISTRKHSRSIKRIIFTKKQNKNENERIDNQEKIDNSKKDDKIELSENEEMGKIYNSFIKILKKGDNVQRKESKKKLLDILNNIEEEKDIQDLKEIKIIEDEKDKNIKILNKRLYELLKELFEKNNVKKKYFFKWKEMLKIKEFEIVEKKRVKSFKRVKIIGKRSRLKDETEESNINNISDSHKNDEKEENILKEKKILEKKEESKKEAIHNLEEKNEEDIYKNILNILKKGDKVQRKESKKKLLNIISNIEDENKFRLITKIREKTYKLLKEAFEKNEVKRKFFLRWASILGLSKKVRRKSITRVIFTKKQNKIIEDIENKDEKGENLREVSDLNNIQNNEKNEEKFNEDNDNKPLNGFEYIELYNDIVKLYKKENKEQRKESKKKIIKFFKHYKRRRYKRR